MRYIKNAQAFQAIISSSLQSCVVIHLQLEDVYSIFLIAEYAFCLDQSILTKQGVPAVVTNSFVREQFEIN